MKLENFENTLKSVSLLRILLKTKIFLFQLLDDEYMKSRYAELTTSVIFTEECKSVTKTAEQQ